MIRQPRFGPDVDHWLGLHFVGPCNTFDLSETQRARVWSHYLLSHMPDEAMTEVVERLVELEEFYRRRATARFEPIAPKTIRGRVTERVEAVVCPPTDE